MKILNDIVAATLENRVKAADSFVTAICTGRCGRGFHRVDLNSAACKGLADIRHLFAHFFSQRWKHTRPVMAGNGWTLR